MVFRLERNLKLPTTVLKAEIKFLENPDVNLQLFVNRKVLELGEMVEMVFYFSL